MFYDLYNKFRRLLARRGLSKYRILRNLDYCIKSIVHRPKDFISVRGYKYFLDPKNSIDESDFDNAEVKIVEELLRPGYMFVDVGAHIGLFTIIASRKVGRTGKVVAFEPNVKSYNILLKNLKENHVSNVIAENMAVSDSIGEDRIYTVGDLWYGSSLIDPRSDPDFYITPNVSDFDNQTIYELRVLKTTLDAYLRNQRVDFVKTDTEGNEGLVWTGMKQIVTNNPNIIVYMEFSPVLLKKFGTNPHKLIQDIKDMGFSIFTVKINQIKKFDIINFGGNSGNILFTRRDINREISTFK